MERSRNGGGGKVVAFEEPLMTGIPGNGGARSTYLDTGRLARPSQPHGAVSRRRTYADGELDVFAAERYFKGAMDGGDHREEDGVAVVAAAPPPLEVARARPVVAVAKPVGTRASKAAASVSARSAASSANSRTVLLRGGRCDHRRDTRCCIGVGVLMRSCSGKRSVRVDSGGAAAKGVLVPGDGAGEPTTSKIDWYRELRMQKAALGLAGGDGGRSNHHGAVVAAAALPSNLNTAKVAAVGREVIREDKVVEFTSSAASRRRSFTLVAPVRSANNVPASGRVGGGGVDEQEDDDGAGSESSSDLFEIKSLMIDECPYEPSEASVQWSVATADASDRGVSARWMTGTGGGGHRWRGGGRQTRDRPPPAGLLSGCVGHRAVEVSAVPNTPRQRSRGCQKAPRNGA